MKESKTRDDIIVRLGKINQDIQIAKQPENRPNVRATTLTFAGDRQELKEIKSLIEEYLREKKEEKIARLTAEKKALEDELEQELKDAGDATEH